MTTVRTKIAAYPLSALRLATTSASFFGLRNNDLCCSKEWHYFSSLCGIAQYSNLVIRTGNGRHFPNLETRSMEMIQRQQRFNRMVTGREQFSVIGCKITFVRGDHQNFMLTAIRFWIVHAIKIRDGLVYWLSEYSEGKNALSSAISTYWILTCLNSHSVFPIVAFS